MFTIYCIAHLCTLYLLFVIKVTKTRKCAFKARYVPLQVMSLHYHYYAMCTLQDKGLNQSVTDGQG